MGAVCARQWLSRRLRYWRGVICSAAHSCSSLRAALRGPCDNSVSRWLHDTFWGDTVLDTGTDHDAGQRSVPKQKGPSWAD